MPLVPLSSPLISARFIRVHLTPGLTVKRRTRFPPLMARVWPVPSKMVFFETTIVFVSVIVFVPPQLKVYGPPPRPKAERRPLSLQSTTPFVVCAAGETQISQEARNAKRGGPTGRKTNPAKRLTFDIGGADQFVQSQ